MLTPNTTRVQHGGATLLFTATLLMLTMATAGAALHGLLAARQVTGWQVERELAFRAAEAALLRAEADWLGAWRSPSVLLEDWPPPGACGTGEQAGRCRPGAGQPPAWTAWVSGGQAPESIGIAQVGTAWQDSAMPPRYVAELLDEGPSGAPLVEHTSAPPRLRITAIGFGRTAAVRAVLQTIVQP